MEGNAELGDEYHTTRKYNFIVKWFEHVYLGLCLRYWWTSQIELLFSFSHLPPTEALLPSAAFIELSTRDPNVKKSVKSRIFKTNLHFFPQVKHKWYIKVILFQILLIYFNEPNKKTSRGNATPLISSFLKTLTPLVSKKTHISSKRLMQKYFVRNKIFFYDKN